MLINGSASHEGLVDLCALGLRAGLCHEEFSTKAAMVVCRHAGFNNITCIPGWNDSTLFKLQS